MRYDIWVAEPVVTSEDVQAVTKALRERRLSGGKYVARFEEALSAFLGGFEVVVVNAGTAALHISLMALGIKPGDEVITTPFSITATSNVIVHMGARPIFADINPRTFNLDSGCVKEKITEKTAAIMPIDYGGQVCDMDEFNEIAECHGILVIEDSAPALGGLYRGRKAGTLGDAGGFSFFPDKNITTGEGGAAVFRDPEHAEIARILRKHGARERYHNTLIGYNWKMPDFAAALGISQLKRLESVIEGKHRLAKYYSDAFEALVGVQSPYVETWNRHTYAAYSILFENFGLRQEAMSNLRKAGIESRIMFPPIHKQPAFVKEFGDMGHYPVAEQAGRRILGLPIYPGLTEEQQDLVIDVIGRVVR